MNVRVNDIEIDTSDWPDDRLATIHELLRQRAAELRLIPVDADAEQSQAGIEKLLGTEVRVPDPTTEECRRWYEAHPGKYRNGDLVHARHILFQITPGAPVASIRALAEAMLKELRINPEVFEKRARDKSNCPSGAQGGQLGQLSRGSTVPEFEKAVFDRPETGILPELIHSRHGFHIVAVDQRIEGQTLPFEAVADRIANELRSASEKRALAQYVRMLAGQADLQGVDLDAATSPLVQ